MSARERWKARDQRTQQQQQQQQQQQPLSSQDQDEKNVSDAISTLSLSSSSQTHWCPSCEIMCIKTTSYRCICKHAIQLHTMKKIHKEWWKQRIPIPSTPPTWNIPPVLAMLLMGTYCKTSSLRLLRGQTSTLLQYIYEMHLFDIWDIKSKAYVECNSITFPKPSGININMLPFILGHRESFPKELMEYWNIITSLPIHPSERGRVCYLTIDERQVKKDESHRRSGVHTEAPGYIVINEGGIHRTEPVYLGWGSGTYVRERMEGGIFMASNISNTCAIWNCRVKDDNIIGKYGSLNHIRDHIPNTRITTEANRIYWITDKTPHESLPLQQDGYRQFFRLVTSRVTAWYIDHSTINPLGVQPGAKIIDGNKFEM